MYCPFATPKPLSSSVPDLLSYDRLRHWSDDLIVGVIHLENYLEGSYDNGYRSWNG